MFPDFICKRKIRRSGGFSLIELLIVIAIEMILKGLRTFIVQLP